MRRRSGILALGTSIVVTAAMLASGLPAAADIPVAKTAQKTRVIHAGSEADARAAALHENRPVAIDSLTTPTSQVSVLPDGSSQLVSNSLPVRVEKAGSWVPVDLSLVAGPDGWLVPKASAAPVRFSTGGSDTLAKVQTDSGAWLGETWSYGKLPQPQVAGAVAMYRDVFPGVDLRLTATAGGMSEVLVINSAAAAANPDLASVQLTMSNATVSTATAAASNPTVATSTVPTAAGQSLLATAADGSAVSSSAPTWWDSSENGSTAAGPAGDGGPRPLPHSSTDTSVSLDVAAVTQGADVTYPVFVDPDWSTGVQAYWFTDRAYPNQSYLNGQYADGIQSVGYGGGYLSRAFWQFGTGPINGKHVLGAQFSVTELWSNTCTGKDIQAWHYGNATPGFTWNTDPGYWNSLQDTKNLSAGSSCSGAAAVGFNVAGAAGWAASTQNGTLQIGLRAANEGDALTRRHFSQGATLTVTYNTPPNTPTGL